MTREHPFRLALLVILGTLLAGPLTLAAHADDTATTQPATTQATTTRPADMQVTTRQPAGTDAFTASKWIDWSSKLCDALAEQDAMFVEPAEAIAERTLEGGRFHLIGRGQPLYLELIGRAGGVLFIGSRQRWDDEKPVDDLSSDTAIAGFLYPPHESDIEKMRSIREAGGYIVGLGRADDPEMKQAKELCDVWIDTQEYVESLPQQFRREGDVLAQTMAGWSLIAEYVAACTRRGKMPVMYKSWSLPDGRDWSTKYGGMRFHDDVDPQAIEPRVLTQRFLKIAQEQIDRLGRTQNGAIEWAAALIVEELEAGSKTVVAHTGHMPPEFVGKLSDMVWARSFGLHHFVQGEVEQFKKAPENSLVFRLGYFGYHDETKAIMEKAGHRVILATTRHPEGEFAYPADSYELLIEMGYKFGDADVKLEGYEAAIIPPSGYMQAITYQAVNVAVHNRLARTATADESDTSSDSDSDSDSENDE